MVTLFFKQNMKCNVYLLVLLDILPYSYGITSLLETGSTEQIKANLLLPITYFTKCVPLSPVTACL